MTSIPPFDDWQATAPHSIRADNVWKMTAYRLALYAIDVGWGDARLLDRVRTTRPIGPQLYRALGSVAANIGEAYSRGSGPDRARMLGYSLGSTREGLAWYFASRRVLGNEAFEMRCNTLSQIRRLLLVTIPAERRRGRFGQGES